jgi:DNA-binding NarL/FixJ family response regulator
MLAVDRSNQAIPGEPVVTLDTVKKHAGHVLGKLGAANRPEAVAPGPRAEPTVSARACAACRAPQDTAKV